MISMKNSVTVILLILLAASCSVEKRQYMGGYHISWNHKSQTQKKQINEQSDNYETSQVTASKETTIEDVRLERYTIFDSVPKKAECDSVFFRTGGDKVAAKIIEINTNEVKYRKCSNPDGPLFVVKKSDVVRIKYANGMEEILSAPVTVKEPKPVKDKQQKAGQERDKENGKERRDSDEKKLYPPALLSMIFGIASIPFGFYVLGIGFAVMAILFGNKSKKKIREDGNLKGYGMAKTGMTLGFIGAGIALMMLLLIIATL
jgi:hypothetical protein